MDRASQRQQAKRYCWPTESLNTPSRFSSLPVQLQSMLPFRGMSATFVHCALWLPYCIKIWLTVFGSPLHPHNLPQSNPHLVDLSVGDIQWQISAEWLETAQKSQWIGEPTGNHHHWPSMTSPSTEMGFLCIWSMSPFAKLLCPRPSFSFFQRG